MTDDAWDCFGSDATDRVVVEKKQPTADTSLYFRLFTERVWGTTATAASEEKREDEMRTLVDAIEPKMSITRRGKLAVEYLRKFTMEGAKECCVEVTEQKRLNEWDNLEWLLAQAYAHVVILMKVVGDGTENRRNRLDEFEKVFSNDARVNVADDPRLPALLREWDSAVTKIARANLDLLNIVIGIDGEENLKKVPSFCGELMREVEAFYAIHRDKIVHDWGGAESKVVKITTKIPEAQQEKKSRDLVQNQIRSESADLSAAAFLQKYFKSQKPCVIRKYANEQKWKLLDLCKTTEFLRDEMFGGQRVVPVEFGYPGSGDCGAGVISLSEFSEALEASNVVDAARGTLRCKKIAYVSQHCLFHHAPELQKFITIPHLTLGKVTSEGASNIWIGTRETRTTLHRDPYNNVFVQVSGFKYVRIYLDDQTEKLYSEAVMTTGKNQVNAFTRSLVKDVENPNVKKFPKFAEAIYFDTILNPGDAMFIPHGAWHYVRSLSTSISVNFWF